MEEGGLRQTGRIGDVFVSAMLRIEHRPSAVGGAFTLLHYSSVAVGDSEDTCRREISLSRRVFEDACWSLVMWFGGG